MSSPIPDYATSFGPAQTSSAFRSVCPSRSLWTRILKRTCGAHNFFLPTYPLDTMSLNELQRAALAPYLFKSRLSRSAIRGADFFHDRSERATLGGRPTHIIQNPTHREPLYMEWNDGVGAAFLVPGGRYLIRLPRYGVVDLYDLGLPVSVRTSSNAWRGVTSAPPTQPIAKAVVPEGVGKVSYDSSRLHVIPLGDGARVRVAVDCEWSLSMADDNDFL